MVKEIESIARDASVEDSADIKISYVRINDEELKVTTKGRTENYGRITSQDDYSWKDQNFPWNRR